MDPKFPLMDLPEEMIVKIISYLPPEDALWRLGFVSKSLLRLSLRCIKVILILEDRYSTKLEALIHQPIVQNVIKHVIMTKHTKTIGREKLLHEMIKDSKDGDSNILNFLGQPEDKEIFILAKSCKFIESLYLIDCDKISDKAFCSLLKSCKKVKTLNLCNFRQLKDSSFKSIALNCKSVVHLDLGNCTNISDSSITEIGSHCTNLESLDLFGCRELTNASMIGLSNKCKKLKKLSLSHCFRIRDEGIAHLVNHCMNISSLELTNCVCLTDKVIFSLASKCQNLKVLILVNCDKLTIAPMESLITKCTNLVFMDIKGCLKISDDKIKRLWVKHKKRLQSLNTGRTCLEEMEKVREVMLEGTLSKEDFDKWRLEYYTGERLPVTKNIG